MAPPPPRIMTASKEARVRSDGLKKTMPSNLSARCLRCGSRFHACAVARIRSTILEPEIVPDEVACFIGRSVKAAHVLSQGVDGFVAHVQGRHQAQHFRICATADQNAAALRDASSTPPRRRHAQAEQADQRRASPVTQVPRALREFSLRLRCARSISRSCIDHASVASSAAQASGEPPNVLPEIAEASVGWRSLSLMSSAPIGTPEAMPFAHVIMSGCDAVLRRGKRETKPADAGLDFIEDQQRARRRRDVRAASAETKSTPRELRTCFESARESPRPPSLKSNAVERRFIIPRQTHRRVREMRDTAAEIFGSSVTESGNMPRPCHPPSKGGEAISPGELRRDLQRVLIRLASAVAEEDGAQAEIAARVRESDERLRRLGSRTGTCAAVL